MDFEKHEDYQRPPGVIPIGKPAIELSPKVSQMLVPAEAAQYIGDTSIRKEINDFLEGYGQMVLVQRMNLKIHCNFCWEEEYGQGDPKCPYCLGRGYLSVLERHPARKQSSLNEHQLNKLTEMSSVGPEVVDEVFWYFEWNVNTQEADMVYEVSWQDDAMLLPFKLIASHRINYAFPYRGSRGRIEYWRTACTSRPIDREIIGEYLRRLTPQIMRVPEDGLIRYVATYRQE